MQTTGKKLRQVLFGSGMSKSRRIDRMFIVQRDLVSAALVAVLTLANSPDRVQAGESRAVIGVGATVLPFAKLEIVHQASALTITEMDIARGYVEARAASRFNVKSNSLAGYALDFQVMRSMFSTVQIYGLGGNAELGPEGGTVTQRASAPGVNPLQLGYRFTLDPDVRAGTYSWPLAASARPL